VTIGQIGVGKQVTDSFVSMPQVMLVGIGLVYVLMLMVTPFGSVLVHVVTVFALPLAVIDSFVAFAVTGRALNLSTLADLLMLRQDRGRRRRAHTSDPGCPHPRARHPDDRRGDDPGRGPAGAEQRRRAHRPGLGERAPRPPARRRNAARASAPRQANAVEGGAHASPGAGWPSARWLLTRARAPVFLHTASEGGDRVGISAVCLE
jgi:hypothetical protein